MKKLAVTICFVTFLAGCNVNQPLDTGSANMFSLSPIIYNKKMEKQFGNIEVDFPKADPELDSYRMAILRSDNRQDYFAGVRWVDFLPTLVQSSMVDSMRDSGYFNIVVADYADVKTNYALQMEIHDFRVDYTISEPPTVKVSIYFIIADPQTQKAIGSFTVSKELKTKADSISEIYLVFDKTFTLVQQEAIERIVVELKEKE